MTIFLMPTHNPDALLAMPALLMLERVIGLKRLLLLIGATLVFGLWAPLTSGVARRAAEALPGTAP